MSRSYEEIGDEVMALPVEERGALAEEIHDSLLTDEEREIENEWPRCRAAAVGRDRCRNGEIDSCRRRDPRFESEV
jgi:hypothetical protein